MRDLFIEDSVDKPPVLPAPSADAAQEIRDSVAGRHVCPFCGAVREQSEGPCPRCTMENTTASRQATKSRIGPWYVYQTRNPAAPGMKFDTLLGFVRKGRVKPRSIVRGPTTHQLWRFAAHVKGLSREFGVCYSCGGAIQPTVSLCPHCNRPQQPPTNADAFIEGQGDAPAKQLRSPEPVMRELEVTPLAADDVIVPPLMPLQTKEGRHGRQDDLDASISDEERAKKAEGFLSPADLAAAFNLDFRPKGGAAPARQSQRRTEQPSRRGYRPKRGRWKWVLGLLLLLAIGLASASVALRPPWRNQAVAMYQQALTWSKQKWAQFTAPEPAKTPAHSAVGTTNPADVDTAASDVSTAAAQTQPAAGVVDVGAATSPAAPEARSKWDSLLKQEADGKTPAAAPDANAGFKQGTLDDTRTLYRTALESERRGDYADAVKKFEQIKEYPLSLRQHDLELQLSRARQHLQ
jgi:hypothetical protein